MIDLLLFCVSFLKFFFSQLYRELSFSLRQRPVNRFDHSVLFDSKGVSHCYDCDIAKKCRNFSVKIQWMKYPVKRYSVWRISRVGIFSAKVHSPSLVDPVSPTMCDSRTICPALNINTALLSSDGCALHSVNFKCFVCVFSVDTGNSWLNTAQ